MPSPVRSRLAALAVSAALVAAACGDASNEADASDPPPASPTVADADPPVEEDEPVEAEPAVGYPLTVEHIYGEAVIEAEPQRVVTIGVAEHDYSLSLGVAPVGLRHYFAGQPFDVWPWAQDELGESAVETLSPMELNIEQIASLEPDVIMAVTSAIDEVEYGLLSGIAPVVARPSGTRYQAIDWRTVLDIHAQVLGRVDEAAAVESALDDLFAGVRAEHPDFAGATVSVLYFNGPGEIGTYTPEDVLFQFLGEMGLDVAPSVDELTTDAVRAWRVSIEQLDLLDADVVVWLPPSGSPVTEIGRIATRDALLSAAGNRSEIAADGLLFSALFNTSPLSAEYIVERLVPELTAALDGDPDTVPPSTAALYDADAAAGAPTADEQAAMDAWQAVLDPNVPLDEKRVHLADSELLEPLVAEASTAAAEVGGVSIRATGASVVADTATVTFDATVGGATTGGLIGLVERVDGVWQVPVDQVCTYLPFIGVECPADAE
ncbi:MAG: ABC transporter substrate-binding protein [Actinomycetota bacterium]